MWDFPLFPEQASTVAQDVDLVYYALVALSAFFGLGVAGVLIYFAVKYRAGTDADRSDPVVDHIQLEIAWIVIPLGLAIAMFVWGAVVYFDLQTPPDEDPIEIYAIGRQWMWKFQHANGAREINTLHVPTGRPVKMIMTSQDVIHSFYVPAFRVKQDVLPGRFTQAWFEASKTGDHRLFCAEYCGTEHSFMEGHVHVMEPEAYEQWLRLGEAAGAEAGVGSDRIRRPGGTERDIRPQSDTMDLSDGVAMIAEGAALFEELRCNACHRTDSSASSPSTAPILEGVFGSTVRLRNEREIIADEQYLVESILYPYAKIVQGYPPVMPTFVGQISDAELMQLVAYLKSLGQTGRSDESDGSASLRDLETASPDDNGGGAE